MGEVNREDKNLLRSTIHFVKSQLKCRNPLNEWKANGAARIAFPMYLILSGRLDTTSTIWVVLKVPGPTRYAIENP